jgi:homogentisate 1,2-dioxygenase
MPRPLETDPKAARLLWYHRNIDVDEVFFVYSGSLSFNDRPTAGRGAGALTRNP